jgi:rhamnogalacturonan endolyase
MRIPCKYCFAFYYHSVSILVKSTKMKFSVLPATLFAAVANAVTLSSTTASYTVSADSANALVVVFSRSNCDITSLKYRGTEVQYQSTGSHIGSGLGSATVSAQTISSNYVLTML